MARRYPSSFPTDRVAGRAPYIRPGQARRKKAPAPVRRGARSSVRRKAQFLVPGRLDFYTRMRGFVFLDRIFDEGALDLLGGPVRPQRQFLRQRRTAESLLKVDAECAIMGLKLGDPGE
jgi:hypothetical protein